MRFSPSKSFETKKQPWISKFSLVETYPPNLPIYKNSESKKRSDLLFRFSLFEIILHLYYFINFPFLFFRFDGWKWNDNICRWIKGGGVKKKKRRKIHARHSVFDTIATRSAGGMSFSANLPSPPPSTLGAAGNRSARSVIDSELLHTTFVRASRCNRVMTENCVITQFIQRGRKKHITDAERERERKRGGGGEHRGLFHGYCCVQFI